MSRRRVVFLGAMNEQTLLAGTRCNTLFFSKAADDFGHGWFLHRIFCYADGVALMKKKIDLFFMLFLSFSFILLVVGWSLNIFKIIASEAITGFVIARCIGVFMAPLGAILGWL